MSYPIDKPRKHPRYITPEGKVCILCDGYYKLPSDYVHGFCFNRTATWLPRELRERFICWECAHYLFKRLCEQAAGAMYKEGFLNQKDIPEPNQPQEQPKELPN